MEQRKRLPFFAAAIVATLLASGCGKTPEAVPAATNVPDIDVTQHVTMALQQNEALKNFNIEVVTVKGDVRLIGMVDNQAQIDEAIGLARASEGAHTIHDELTIKK